MLYEGVCFLAVVTVLTQKRKLLVTEAHIGVSYVLRREHGFVMNYAARALAAFLAHSAVCPYPLVNVCAAASPPPP